jgi:bifunctional non-homologous end joining protein LigD
MFPFVLPAESRVAPSLLLLLSRIAAGTMFAVSGWNKLFTDDGRDRMLATLVEAGIPWPAAIAPAVAMVEWVLGTTVVLGVLPRLSAAALMMICAVAAFTDGIGRIPAGLGPLDWLSWFLYLPEVPLGVALAWVCVLGAGRYALWTGRGASPTARTVARSARDAGSCILPEESTCARTCYMTTASASSPAIDLCAAALAADVATVQAGLAAGADVSAENAYGFTALECAARATNDTPAAQHLQVLRLLIDAGSPLEHLGRGGRTALYLAAEFARECAPVQMLLDAGANPAVHDGFGNHIVVNAMVPEVQALLSGVTGHPIPVKAEPRPPQKMRAADWRAAHARITAVFARLEEQGIVTAQDVGLTQEDGFTDTAQQFIARGGMDAGLIGLCFYTRQDLNRAKRSSDLSLGFWAGPEGAGAAMEQVGRRIVDAFTAAGLVVDWDGSASHRPTVDLRGVA